MRILVHRNGQQLGPFTLEEVRTYLANGSIAPGDLAWQEGTTEWVPVISLTGAPGVGTGTPLTNPVSSTSGLAIASFILGLLSFVTCVSGIPAVICGHLSHSEIRRSNGTLKGGGLATAGLVTGYLSIAIVFLVVAAAIVIPVYNSAYSAANATVSLAQAKRLAVQCQAYASDHGGKFPSLLEDLVPDYIQDNRGLADPAQKGSEEIGYLYFGTGRIQSERLTGVLLESKAVYNGKRIVALYDGSAKTVPATTPPVQVPAEPAPH